MKLLLPADEFPDVDVYRVQADHLAVTGKCTCGCPTVHFTVDATKARRATVRGKPILPVEAEAGDPTGNDYVQLILFARDGWLESLELVWFGPHPPARFPQLSEIRLLSPPSEGSPG